MSRIQPNCFLDKPVALISVTAGPGNRSIYDLRKYFVFLKGIILNQDVSIGANYTKFDKESNLTDEATKKLITDQMTSFKEWIKFVRKGQGKTFEFREWN